MKLHKILLWNFIFYYLNGLDDSCHAMPQPVVVDDKQNIDVQFAKGSRGQVQKRASQEQLKMSAMN